MDDTSQQPAVLTEALVEQIKSWIRDVKVDELKTVIDHLHPADIATVMNQLSRLGQNVIFDLLSPEIAGEVLMELEEPHREDVVETLDPKTLSKIVDQLPSDEAADLVGELDEEVAREVLEGTPEESRREVEKLLHYGDDTAGGIMALEVAKIHENQTVAQAQEELRNIHKEVEDIHTLFVVDDHGRLKGTIKPINLILATPNTPVANIMETDVISVPPEMDQQEAAAVAMKYDLVTLPVVDQKGTLLGRITIDDIIDVVEEEAHEDISFMAGTGDEEVTERSALKVTRTRIPWLMVGMFGGMIAAYIMSHFEGSLSRVIALAFFVPVVTGMGGNVAIQCSSIIVRGLATGELVVSNIIRQIWKEFRVAVTNGAILGGIIFVAVSLWHNDWNLGLVIGGAICAVNLTATATGTMFPFVLRWIGFDPAVAMGPFISTLNDIIGISIYFGFASLYFAFHTP
jgi:magnesium transporter